jgi:chemotaxis signal transduction protein
MADLVVVEAGGQKLAIAAARVREVAAVSTVTPVPTAPAPVLGLTQVRGQIVPVLDLAMLPSLAKLTNQLVNFPDEARMPRPQDPLVVVELGPARAALWVDRVLGVQASSGDEPIVVEIGALFDQLRAAIASQVKAP